MNSISKVWESKSLIRFSDCDPFNHLNNARYLDYFINAREDHLVAHMNFNIYHYAVNKGKGWVVARSHIAYLKPALLMETVVISSTVLNFGEKDLLVEMKMWDESKQKLKAVLWSVFAHVNVKTQRSEAHDEELMQTFKPLENPLPSPVSFEERVEQLKAM